MLSTTFGNAILNFMELSSPRAALVLLLTNFHTPAWGEYCKQFDQLEGAVIAVRLEG